MIQEANTAAVQIALKARELAVLLDHMPLPGDPKDASMLQRTVGLAREIADDAVLTVGSGGERRGFGTLNLAGWAVLIAELIKLLKG